MKIFLLCFIVSFSNLLSAAEKNTPITCLTSKCHSELSKSPFLHSPLKAKGCIMCHELQKFAPADNLLPKDHPIVAKKMVNEQKSCNLCHVEWDRKFKKLPHAHSAIDKKGCTSCHNPHGADNKHLLKEKEQCITCHVKGENWEKGENREESHKALTQKKQCLNCHEVHAGKRKNLLTKDIVPLCIECHEEYSFADVENKNLLHTPVKKGECLKCHSAHYSSQGDLLEKVYEGEDGYVKNVESSFQLCFSCHDPAKTTQFRNGEVNLHTFHTQAKFNDKLHGCSVCHEVHKSSQQMLIRTKFNYKGINVPIKFTKTEKGGNCATACHKELGYDRISPITNLKDK